MKDGETGREFGRGHERRDDWKREREPERERNHERRHGRGGWQRVSTHDGELNRGRAAESARRATGWLARPGLSDIAYAAVAVLLALFI
ncbi:MAG: hypothetical protein ACM3ZU_05555, partial [Bacteroidota bacterium]